MTNIEKLIERMGWQPKELAPSDTNVLVTNTDWVGCDQYESVFKTWLEYGDEATHFMPIPTGKEGEVIRVLVDGINRCLENNSFLADGKICSLMDLQEALSKAEELAGE